MATPIVEDISANLVAALELITVGNGYENTVTVERHKRTGNDPVDKLLVVHMDSSFRLIEDVINHHVWLQTYFIVGYVVEAEDSVVAIDTRINSLRSDVGKALMVDPQRNNLAIDTIAGGVELFETPDSIEGFIAEWSVQYRTLEADPFSG